MGPRLICFIIFYIFVYTSLKDVHLTQLPSQICGHLEVKYLGIKEQPKPVTFAKGTDQHFSISTDVRQIQGAWVGQPHVRSNLTDVRQVVYLDHIHTQHTASGKHTCTQHDAHGMVSPHNYTGLDQSVKFRVGGCDLCGRNLTDVTSVKYTNC